MSSLEGSRTVRPTPLAEHGSTPTGRDVLSRRLAANPARDTFVNRRSAKTARRIATGVGTASPHSRSFHRTHDAKTPQLDPKRIVDSRRSLSKLRNPRHTAIRPRLRGQRGYRARLPRLYNLPGDAIGGPPPERLIVESFERKSFERVTNARGRFGGQSPTDRTVSSVEPIGFRIRSGIDDHYRSSITFKSPLVQRQIPMTTRVEQSASEYISRAA